MSVALAVNLRLETDECCICGVTWAWPAYMRRQALESSERWFYCPNGHKQHFSKSEIDRLREKLTEQTRIATEQAERALKAERAKKLTALKLRNLKKRAAAGVCPCCHRTFSQVARHMATKHPEYEAK